MGAPVIIADLAHLSAGDGSGLPSVTRIVEAAGLGADWSKVPPLKLAAAQARGTAVHRACELAATNDLDIASVPEGLRGYVAAFRGFVVDTGWEPILIETRLIHPLGFTGQPDTVGWMFGQKRRQLDLKTPISLAPGPLLLQLAAYDQLHAANYPAEPLDGTATLQLGVDGRYRLRPRTDLAVAWSVFVAALLMLRAEATREHLAAIDAWSRRYPQP